MFDYRQNFIAKFCEKYLTPMQSLTHFRPMSPFLLGYIGGYKEKIGLIIRQKWAKNSYVNAGAPQIAFCLLAFHQLTLAFHILNFLSDGLLNN